jgi:hypothetical protein
VYIVVNTHFAEMRLLCHSFYSHENSAHLLGSSHIAVISVIRNLFSRMVIQYIDANRMESVCYCDVCSMAVGVDARFMT